MVFAEIKFVGKWGEAACVADIFACYFAYGHRSQYSCGIDKMYLFKRVRKDTATHADKPHFYDSAVLTRRTYSKEYAKVAATRAIVTPEHGTTKNMDKIVFLCYYVNRNCEVEDYGCHKLYW